MVKKLDNLSINSDALIGSFVSLQILFLFISERIVLIVIETIAISLIWACILIKNKKKVIVVRLIVCVLSFLIWIMFYSFQVHNEKATLLLKENEITHIRGRLVKDSVYTRTARGIYTIKIKNVENRDMGIVTEAHGIASVSVPSSLAVPLISGEEVEFNISGYRNNLFYASGITSVKKNDTIVRLRKALLLDAYDRVRVLYKTDISESAYYSRNLASMLLLSRGDSDDDIKKEAANVGVAHVFALSGAHLMLIATFFSFFLSLFIPPFVVSKINSVILGFYVFIIGPSPSLVRSYFMYVLNANFKSLKPYVIYLTVILQSLFYQYTITSLSFKLSYVCVCSLVVFNSLVSYSITFRFLKKFSSLVATGLTALIFSSPISIRNFGTWSPCGIILSPLIMFFAILCMIGGVFNLVFCPSRIGAFLMKNSYVAIRFILDTFNKSASHFSWRAYYVLLSIMILMFALKTFLYKKQLKC